MMVFRHLSPFGTLFPWIWTWLSCDKLFSAQDLIPAQIIKQVGQPDVERRPCDSDAAYSDPAHGAGHITEYMLNAHPYPGFPFVLCLLCLA